MLISRRGQNSGPFGRFLAIEGLLSMEMMRAVAYAEATKGRDRSPVGNSRPQDGRSAPTLARAEPAEEVRRLTRPHGEPLRSLWLGARAAGPLVALLTASRALVWQENEPQFRPDAAALQRLVRRPAASRPFAASSRCRGSSWSSLRASWSRGRRDLIMTFQTTPPRPPRPTC